MRAYSSEESEFERCTTGNTDQRTAFEPKYPPAKAGLNQWTWDMRREGLHCIDDIRLFGGFDGARVIPGTYDVRIAIGDAATSGKVTLLPDPRVEASASDFAFLDGKLREATALMNEVLDTLDAAREARDQAKALLADYPDAAELQAAGKSAVGRLTDWEALITQVNYQTLEDEDSMPPMLDAHVHHVLDVIDGAGAPVSAGSLERLQDLQREWATRKTELAAISASDIAAINAWARANGIAYVTPPGG